MSKNEKLRAGLKLDKGEKREAAKGPEYVEAPKAALTPPAEAEPQPVLKPVKVRTKLEDVRPLSKPALALLDRAIQTSIKNRGQGLDDANAKIRLGSQAELLETVQGNLALAAMAINESPTPEDLNGPDRRPNRVFSLIYNVMRSVVFLSNGALRRWLDPRPTMAVADHGEARPAPWGLEPESDDENFEATLADAVDEIQAYFGALVQACGFELVPDGDAGLAGGLDGAFPLCYEVMPDLTLKAVSDFHRAMDLVETKRKASLARRAVQEEKAMTGAKTRALELLAAMQAKKPTATA